MCPFQSGCPDRKRIRGGAGGLCRRRSMSSLKRLMPPQSRRVKCPCKTGVLQLRFPGSKDCIRWNVRLLKKRMAGMSLWGLHTGHPLFLAASTLTVIQQRPYSLYHVQSLGGCQCSPNHFFIPTKIRCSRNI